MYTTSAFRVNEPHVISEVIEGEVIILNFEQGSYYSLNESGMAVWQGILDGLGRNDLLRLLARRYDCVEATLERDLSQLLKTLEEEQLIVQNAGPANTITMDAEGSRSTYVKPHLDKFTDLQDLLLLDPIHDVDEAGWPHNPR
jgi:hypothetical protein